MVTIAIKDGKMIAEIQGMHKLWACKSRLEIPLEHISAVRARPDEAKSWWRGWKIVGTDWPGKFAAGLFYRDHKWVFWDVTDPELTIEVDLVDQHLNQLLLQVEDPDEACRLIEDAIASVR